MGNTFISLAVILVVIFLVTIILVQVKGEAGNLFGGGGTSFRTRRGVEKTLFQLTIGLAVIFVILAIVNIRLS